MRDKKRFYRHLAVIILAAAACRLGPLLALGPLAEPDTAAYMQIAVNLAADGNFSETDLLTGKPAPSAYRMPLFPALMAGLIKFFGPDIDRPLAAVNLIFSLLTVAAAALLFRLLAGPAAGLAAGYLAAFNPNAVFNNLLLLTDTVFVFFSMAILLAGIWALRRRSGPAFFLWGAVIGLSVLVRPVMKFFWAAPLIAVFVPFFGAALKEKARLGALAALGMAVLLLPWAARNQSRVGFFGLEAYQGVNTLWSTIDLVKPSTPEERLADPRLAQMRDIVAGEESALAAEAAVRRAMRLSVPETSAGLTRIGLETYLRNPGTAALRALRNFVNTATSPNSVMELVSRLGGKGPAGKYFPELRAALRQRDWPALAVNLGTRLFLFLVFFIFAPLGALLLWRRAGAQEKLELLLPLLLIAYLFPLTSLVAGYDRYRLPLDPLLFGLAAAWLLARAPGGTALPGRQDER